MDGAKHLLTRWPACSHHKPPLEQSKKGPAQGVVSGCSRSPQTVAVCTGHVQIVCRVACSHSLPLLLPAIVWMAGSMHGARCGMHASTHPTSKIVVNCLGSCSRVGSKLLLVFVKTINQISERKLNARKNVLTKSHNRGRRFVYEVQHWNVWIFIMHGQHSVSFNSCATLNHLTFRCDITDFIYWSSWRSFEAIYEER